MLKKKNWLISIDYFINSKNNHITLFEDRLREVEVKYSFTIGEIDYDSLIKGISNLVGEIHQDSCLGEGLHKYYKKPNIEFVQTSDLWRLPDPFYRESHPIELNDETVNLAHDYFLELQTNSQIKIENHFGITSTIKNFDGKAKSLSSEGRCFYSGLFRLKKAFLPIIIH